MLELWHPLFSDHVYLLRFHYDWCAQGFCFRASLFRPEQLVLSHLFLSRAERGLVSKCGYVWLWASALSMTADGIAGELQRGWIAWNGGVSVCAKRRAAKTLLKRRIMAWIAEFPPFACYCLLSIFNNISRFLKLEPLCNPTVIY